MSRTLLILVKIRKTGGGKWGHKEQHLVYIPINFKQVCNCLEIEELIYVSQHKTIPHLSSAHCPNEVQNVDILHDVSPTQEKK